MARYRHAVRCARIAQRHARSTRSGAPRRSGCDEAIQSELAATAALFSFVAKLAKRRVLRTATLAMTPGRFASASCSVFNCQTAPGFALSSYAGHAHLNFRRASSPRVQSGPRACRSSCSSISPKGRAERQGVSPRPRRHVRAHGLRVLWAHGKQTASEAAQRPRSAREWISRLAACPRGCRLRRRAPFVRAVARTCTWTVRPCCRCLSPVRAL